MLMQITLNYTLRSNLQLANMHLVKIFQIISDALMIWMSSINLDDSSDAENIINSDLNADLKV